MRKLRPLRIDLLCALAALVALAVVPAAQAANLVTPAHNPGFEDPCPPPAPSTPCAWDTTTGAAAIVQDPLHNSGSYSAKVTLTNVDANGIISTCIQSTLTTGDHLVSYWYHTTDSNVGQLYMNYIAYASNDCTGVGQGDPNGALTVSSVKDANWHQVNGFLHNSSTKNSLKVELFFQCTPCSGAPVTTTGTVYYDDVTMDDAGITGVQVASFTAGRASSGVRLHWRTGTEADMLGFHVYRYHLGKRVRVDRGLIAAKSSVSGARYTFLDRRAPRGKLTYRLQAVGADGSRTWFGPACVAR